MTETLQGIFDLLISNKSFPNYQAERRVDIFINYFSKKILDSFLQEETTFVCPEFPLKLKQSNRSTKLDYLYATASQPIFIELKTDTFSLKQSQAESYLSCSWNTCVSDLYQIAENTSKSYRKKYDHLIAKIEELKFSNQNPAIRVVYLSPLEKDKDPFTNLKYLKIKKVADLDILINKDEKPFWDFIKSLDLYVFEVL